jgi:sialate O-acetylesterase
MQLAAYVGGNNTLIAEIRDVQLNTTLSTPNTAIASATDLGDLYSPQGNIHPRTKVVNSRRMARAMAGVLYGVAGAQRGPTYASAAAEAAGCVRVAFEPASVAGGLMLAPPANIPEDAGRLPSYNVAWPAVLGSDGAWRNATWALGAGNTFVLCAPMAAGVTPKATQYAWGNWPVNTLYNDEGLPAMPWRRWL